jgi:penicillin amidase/acyl-homoserine-lactone acylase
VLSANHSPFAATDGAGNPDPGAFPPSLGIERYRTNRARRLLELFTPDPAVTREAFDRYKLDAKYSAESNVARRLRVLTEGPLPRNPLARAGVELLRRWDLGTDPANPAAALALLVLRPRDNDQLPPISHEELVVRLERAAAALQERYGRIDVPFGEVHRIRRGAVDLPIDGGPDTVRAVYAREAADGRLVGWAGDSYVLLVEWDESGRVSSRSIQPYGSAAGRPRSTHYADQAPLFARGELRPVWRGEEEIRAHLEREYRPGRE